MLGGSSNILDLLETIGNSIDVELDSLILHYLAQSKANLDILGRLQASSGQKRTQLIFR
jgi:hypothetical protein